VTTAKNAGAFEVLDDEMVILILNFLQSTAKFPALVTNKCFLALRKDSRLWKELVLKIGPQSWHSRTNLLLPCSTAARLTTLIPTTHLKKLHIESDKKFDMMQAKAFVAGLSDEAPVTDLAVFGDRLRGSQITKLITAKIGSKIQTLRVHKPDTATFYLKNSPNITSLEVTDGIDSSQFIEIALASAEGRGGGTSLITTLLSSGWYFNKLLASAFFGHGTNCFPELTIFQSNGFISTQHVPTAFTEKLVFQRLTNLTLNHVRFSQSSEQEAFTDTQKAFDRLINAVNICAPRLKALSVEVRNVSNRWVKSKDGEEDGFWHPYLGPNALTLANLEVLNLANVGIAIRSFDNLNTSLSNLKEITASMTYYKASTRNNTSAAVEGYGVEEIKELMETIVPALEGGGVTVRVTTKWKTGDRNKTQYANNYASKNAERTL